MLLDEFHGTASATLDAPAGAVFDLLVDISRLPEWNTHIERVLDDPRRGGHRLDEGDEWVVQIHAMGTRWPSRARVVLLDRVAMRFEYTSRTDDGNPSYMVWSWLVTAHGGGSQVTVSWAGYPKTFWRRALLTRMRAPLLDGEVRASLAGLDDYLARASTNQR